MATIWSRLVGTSDLRFILFRCGARIKVAHKRNERCWVATDVCPFCFDFLPCFPVTDINIAVIGRINDVEQGSKRIKCDNNKHFQPFSPCDVFWICNDRTMGCTIEKDNKHGKQRGHDHEKYKRDDYTGTDIPHIADRIRAV